MSSTTRAREPQLQQLEVQNPIFLALTLTALLVGTLGIASPALARRPLAPEFQVNTYYDLPYQWTPSVSRDADGDFVVVWLSRGPLGSYYSSIQGQRYDVTGAPVGFEFQVNTYTPGYQLSPSVSLDADGDFVVVWHSYGSAGSDTDDLSVQGQRYDAAGAPLGSEFQVNTYTTSYQLSSSVSLDADGDFVVVWDSGGSAGTDTFAASVQVAVPRLPMVPSLPIVGLVLLTALLGGTGGRSLWRGPFRRRKRS
jgi:hypothetical protein